MPWVKFFKDFNYTHPATPMQTTGYKAGMQLQVTTPCAEEAIAKGCAVRAPKRKESDEQEQPSAPAEIPEAGSSE